MSDQQSYFSLLESIGLGPIYSAQSYLQGDKYTPGRRIFIEASKFPVDYRTVFSNEIVFELDASSYAQNYKYAVLIIEALRRRSIPFSLYASGGKGIHIEIFFKKPDFPTDDMRKLFEDALERGLKFKDVRQFIFDSIMEDTTLPRDLIGKSKTIDTNSILFDDEHNKTRLLRACGGRKLLYDKVTKDTETFYKTYINEADFTKDKPKIKKLDDVKYPDEIKQFDIDLNEFAHYLKTFVDKRPDDVIAKRVKLDGLYIDLPGVKKIRKGMSVGLRAEGAKILSIALRNDKFSFNLAEKEMESYVKNCSQQGESFTLREGVQWLKWAYNQPDIFWSPGLLRSLGGEYYTEDEYIKKVQKDSFKLLESSDVLKQIDNFLSKVIVGEEENRMLLFLLMLTKKFPVHPEWNIPGDPKPAAVILSSQSSSGKSYITKALLKLMGEEGVDYFMFSRMSKTSLNYFTDADMTNKVVFIEELQSVDETSNQLRLWISEGKLRLSTVEKKKGEDGEEHNAIVIKETRGQPVFVTGTAEEKLEEQLSTRSWLVSLDISQEQTKKIMKFQDVQSMEPTLVDREELKKIRDAIRCLKSYHFIIPYLDYQLLDIPTLDVRVRRDYAKLRDLICCSALLHQYQRKLVRDPFGREYVVANLKDYSIARDYAQSVLSNTFMGMTKHQHDLIETLKKSSFSELDFKVSDVMRLTGWSQSKCWNILNQLSELGFLTSERDGHAFIFQLNPLKKDSGVYLPTAKELEGKLVTKESNYSDFMSKQYFNSWTVINHGFLEEDVIVNSLQKNYNKQDTGSEPAQTGLDRYDTTDTQSNLTITISPTVKEPRWESFIKDSPSQGSQKHAAVENSEKIVIVESFSGLTIPNFKEIEQFIRDKQTVTLTELKAQFGNEGIDSLIFIWNQEGKIAMYQGGEMIAWMKY